VQRTCCQCGQAMPHHRPLQAKYCSTTCKSRADYERHGEQRRAAVRKRYAEQHGSPGEAVTRVALCQQCGEQMSANRGAHARYCSDLCKWRRAAEVRYPRDRGPRPCRWCRESFTPADHERPHVTYCSEYCRNKRNATDNAAQRAIVKANWRHSRRAQFVGAYISAREWTALVDRYRGRCAYCGVSPHVLTQDHVVPVARGGAHELGNIVPACQACNSSKGDKLLDEWKQSPGYARCMTRAETVYL
jgi:5-methylcytosine-specific restriction endonuclease McrA